MDCFPTSAWLPAYGTRVRALVLRGEPGTRGYWVTSVKLLWQEIKPHIQRILS